MTLEEDLDSLSTICGGLLSGLAPEVEYVKRYMEETCAELLREGWSDDGGEPHWTRILALEECTVQIALIHGRKGERITGADLAFELRDQKVVFVQAKRAGPRGRIHFNRFQLYKLLDLEAQLCAANRHPASVTSWGSGFLTRFAPPWCLVAYYHLIMGTPSETEERLYHASEVSFVLGQRKSCSQGEFKGHGLRPEDFRDLFWRCTIGGPDLDVSIKREVFWNYSLLTGRLVLWIDVALAQR